MKNVIVYTTENCSRCVGAKALLNRRAVAFEEINLAGDPDARETLARQTGRATFPQIVIEGETLGGFDELLAADRTGRLPGLLAV